MLARRALGRGGGRATLPRARPLVAGSQRRQAQFLLEDVGPGTRALCELEAGRAGARRSGRSGTASARRRRARRAILVGGGVGIAPLAILQDRCSGGHRRDRAARLPRRRARRAARAASRAPRSPATTARVGHHGPVTELLDARARSATRAQRSTRAGPPAMLEGVRACAAAAGVPAQLALEAPMACGFGACFGCVVPLRDGRLPCASASTARCSTPTCSPALRSTRVPPHERRLLRPQARAPGHQRLGHLRRARRAQRLRRGLVEDFPFAAYVSKTITLEPRAGNPPPRLWELARPA